MKKMRNGLAPTTKSLSRSTAAIFAIKDQGVFAAEDEIEKLLDVLREKGIDINLVFISSIPPKGVAAIL